MCPREKSKTGGVFRRNTRDHLIRAFREKLMISLLDVIGVIGEAQNHELLGCRANAIAAIGSSRKVRGVNLVHRRGTARKDKCQGCETSFERAHRVVPSSEATE